MERARIPCRRALSNDKITCSLLFLPHSKYLPWRKPRAKGLHRPDVNTVASYRENYVSAASGAYTNRLSPNWQGLRQTYDAIRAYSENLLEVRQFIWLFGLYHERWPDTFLFSFPEKGRGCPSEGFARESRVPEDSSGFSPFSRFWRPPHAVGWNH